MIPDDLIERLLDHHKITCLGRPEIMEKYPTVYKLAADRITELEIKTGKLTAAFNRISASRKRAADRIEELEALKTLTTGLINAQNDAEYAVYERSLKTLLAPN